ncbi:MAG: hypothetical protein IPN95_02695 [Bacteroidetes bacterium]|nr:hypothetical protein [Bacteroidota bacterium]
MQRFLLATVLTCWALAATYAQYPGQMAPPHDICAKAIVLDEGDLLTGHTNADATPSLPFESPEVFEATCIQTIENDVWYKFQAAADVDLYEITIVASFCTTPAGLQALLIQADGCNASSFVYRGCSNKITTDTIKLYLPAPEAGQNYFVWVDGYDGTVCEFDIALRARKRLTAVDYRFLRFDYSLENEPIAEIADLQPTFANNTTTLNWSAEPNEAPDLYIIELLPDLAEVKQESRYARVVGFVDPHRFVGSGRTAYSFTDYVTPFNQGKTYRYRIVSVSADGIRLISQTMEVKAKLVESFDVREVKAGPEAGKFQVHYINRKKGARYFISVENAANEKVKQMTFESEPIRDGDITIDMSALPHGEYMFMMSNGKDVFKRSFIW